MTVKAVAKRPKLHSLAGVCAACFLSACAAGQQAFRPPPLTPAPVAPVQTSSLPPVATQPGTFEGIAGETGVDPLTQQQQDLQAIPGQASAVTGVVGVQEVSVSPDIDFGRNAVLGAWNAAAQGDTCAMNLSLTTWTGGFRASTRGCTNATLQSIGAWQLSGKQLTLLDTTGATLARLFPSGPNRFDGVSETGNVAVTVFR